MATQMPHRDEGDVAYATAALTALGFHADDLQVLRDGSRSVLLSERAGIVARIHDREVSLGEVSAHLDVVRHLVRDGARILPVAPVDPVMLPNGRILSVWPAARPGRTDAVDLADILRSLHECPDPGLPAWDPIADILGRLALRSHTWLGPTALQAVFQGWAEDLANTQRRPRAPVPIHADAHVENAMDLGGRYVLSDLDGICLGPREADLAVPLTDHPREQAPQADIDRLLDAYGLELIDPGTLAWCCDVRELNVMSWLAVEGHNRSGSAAELDRWLRTIGPASGWWRHAAVAGL